MNYATFVLSTGRCGTQWLAATLAAMFGPRAEVVHEPLHDDYLPRQMLGADDPHRLSAELAAPILEHVEHIEKTLETRHYVECGFPSWSSIPYLTRRFAGRVRVIHLTRHPIPTAISWVTQTAFTPPLLPHLPEKVLLSPFDEGITFTDYRERWSSLAPYEKALFYWAEVHALGLRLETVGEMPWLRVSAERLLREAGELERVIDFIGTGGANPVNPAEPVDEFRFVTRMWSDPASIAKHPEVVSIAAALGYDALAFDAAQLERRYRAT